MPIDIKILNQIKGNDPELTSLDLSYQHLTASDMQVLAEACKQNTYLTELNLTGNPIGDEGAAHLYKIVNLTSLVAVGAKIGPRGAQALAHHQSLREVDLSHNHIGNIGAIAFANHPFITKLKLAGNKIDHEGVGPFAENKTLLFLDLSENQLGDKGAVILSDNSTLTTLNLAVNHIGDLGANALAKHPTVTTLGLNHNNISAEGVEGFSINSRLVSLYLKYNKIGVEGAQKLARSKSLINVFLSGNGINHIGIGALLENEHIQVLDVSYNQIDDEGLVKLKFNKTLVELTINHNHLTSACAKYFREHSTLRVLSASYNFFGDEGAIEIAQSNSITSLDLVGNQIGPLGALAFANNRLLKKLALSYNLLGNEGAIRLSANTTLYELYLSYNNIGDEGACALALMKTLKVLKVNYNHIKNKGREALQANKHFKSLSISSEQPPDFTDKNLDTIFKLSQNLLCILGLDGNIQFFNPTFSRVLGYEDDELLNTKLIDLLHPDDRNGDPKPLYVNESGKFPVLQYSRRYRRKDGAYRIIEWSSQAEHQRIYASGIDVTKRIQADNYLKKIEQQQEMLALKAATSEQYSKRQADFIAHLCHEIRNPLGGIISTLDAIRLHCVELSNLNNSGEKHIPDNTKEKVTKVLAEINECLSDISMCTAHEESILNDNLLIERISDNRLEIANEVFDLKQTINDVYRIFKGRTNNKRIIFKIILPEEPLAIKGDPLKIKQILINLVSNAIKYTNQGYIELTLKVLERSASQTHLKFSVKDTGIGLTSDELSQLFNRFTQANSTLGDQYRGSGLGLYIAKELAELMGGGITVESEKGKGSTFHCTVQCGPLLHLEEKPATIIMPSLTHDKSQQSFPTQKLTILVVDDNAINRKSLEFILTKEGHNCITAIDGEDAVNKYKQRRVDIILMDIVMPNIDGLNSTRLIRHHEKENNLPRIPIIALTGNTLEKHRKEALGAGMDDYLTKPFKKENILKKIAIFFPLDQSVQNISPLHSAPPTHFTPQQSIWHFPSQPSLTSKRVWLDSSFRNRLYPTLDQLSNTLHALNIKTTLPASRFIEKSSQTGWQLYSIKEKDEYWAVLNLTSLQDAERMVDAIRQHNPDLVMKIMQSGGTYAVTLIFSKASDMSAEINKIIMSIKNPASSLH